MHQDTLQQAVQIIRDGGIVIYPTDTAFGIGCRMDDQKAVDRLFAIRKRPRTQATPVLVSSWEQALTYYLDPQEIVRRLIKKYWPGALTIIAKCKKNLVYSPIRGGSEKIGFRMPNHEIALKFIRGVGVPILGPSANFHGLPTPYRYEDLDPELVNLVDCVVPGVCPVGNASTVVDCSVTPYLVLRQGVIALPSATIMIDSSGSEAIRVAVKTSNGDKHERSKPVSHAKAQEVLPMVEDMLKEHTLTLSDVTAIEVYTGPGSYTGLRVGIAIANTLGVLLGVSVNNLAVGQIVTPVYEGDRYPSPNPTRW
ncbi:MAG: L-threonylcarbamoyladenylate synthase [Patescibacteria group bacterium]